mgnify:CR=1 FL=1
MELHKQLNRFHYLQNQLLQTVERLGSKHYCNNEDTDISPIGWHLLHCIYVETYWLKEKILKIEKVPDQLEQQGNPLNSEKINRGKNLPEFNSLINWAKHKIAENRNLLLDCLDKHKANPLVKNNYILQFLISHHAQHFESMKMGMTARIKNNWNRRSENSIHIQSTKPKSPGIQIKEGYYNIGNGEQNFSFDNEKPSHSVYIKKFLISKNPVTNSEWKGFMEDGGYKKKEFWTSSGWIWKKKNNIFYPSHWLKCDNEKFVMATPSGITQIGETEPVMGVSYHEAKAFANWCGCILPHEYQWEIAFTKILDKNLVWEWCSNLFFPYPGFEFFPYRNYSIPSFDYNHKVLRGGSKYTEIEIARKSFRNYYNDNRRNLFSGLRLAN